MELRWFMVKDWETLPRSPLLSHLLISKTKCLHKTYHCLKSLYSAFAPERLTQVPALQNLNSLDLGWASSIWVSKTSLVFVHMLLHLLAISHSSFKSQFQWHLLWSLHPSEGRCSPTVLLSTLYRFLQHFAHLTMLQFIHLCLSSRVPSPLRKRTTSLICYF